MAGVATTNTRFDAPSRLRRWPILQRMLRYPVRPWLAPALVTIVAGFLRFFRLGTPRELVFDETYYVKQAYSLLALGYEGRWAEDSDAPFAAGNFSGLQTEADYVVHPPLAKWLIAAGLRLFGAESSFGWRFTAALLGTLTVFLLARAATHIFNSSIFGAAAGLLLAVDGLHLVHSRTALLDIFLTFFVVAAFTTLVCDHISRRDAPDPPRLRPWLIATGVLLGLACAVKWSGIYYAAAFGIVAVIWECSRRLRFKDPHWLRRGLILDGISAFVQMIPTAALTYVLAWLPWFLQPQAYLRQWAAENPGDGALWLPPALRSLWEYHTQMWQFHNSLTSSHTYAADPWGWILQLRPTSFFYEAPPDCGAQHCSAAITSLGNPALWWGGALALLLLFILWLWWNDGRAGLILAGVAGGWLPWFIYASRTIFTFYAVVFAPFMALAIVYAVHLISHAPPGLSPVVTARRRNHSLVVLAAVCTLAVLLAVYFYPVWTAVTIPYEHWHWRMWLPSWV